ncbi:MAG: 16S rRNA (uracil(1498)-N(3))-methyltransferase [Hyphomicrobiaceae bacterium]
MPIRDFHAQRLFIDAPMVAGVEIRCTKEQSNYLLNVLRMKPGDGIIVFNGSDGAWRAELATAGRRDAMLHLAEQTQPQDDGPDIDYLFAPLKRARLDYMVQKATELGVRRLRPVITRRTQADRINLDRMRANVIEAAEQCGILRIPEIAQPEPLVRVIEHWDTRRPLVFCDESSDVADPIAALSGLFPPVAVLIGPEGGFDAAERDMLRERPFTRSISLGPRIMRADTAAVAALALVQAVAGDWR